MNVVHPAVMKTDQIKVCAQKKKMDFVKRDKIVNQYLPNLVIENGVK